MLHIEKLPETLVITNINLMESIGRKASNLESLSICEMTSTSNETKKAMVALILAIFESKTTPTTLKLRNLGFEVADFEEIF